MNVQGILVALSLATAVTGCAEDEPRDGENGEREDAIGDYYPSPPQIDVMGSQKIVCTERCDFELSYYLEGQDFGGERALLAVEVLYENDLMGTVLSVSKDTLVFGEGSELVSSSVGESTVWRLAYLDMAPGNYRIEVNTEWLKRSAMIHVAQEVVNTIEPDWPHIGDGCEFSFCGGDTSCTKITSSNEWTCTAPCIMDAQCPDGSCQSVSGEGGQQVCAGGKWSQ